MFDMGDCIAFDGSKSCFYGTAAMSEDGRWMATLEKSGSVSIRHSTTMSVYRTITIHTTKASVLFLQTFAAHDTLLVRSTPPCITEYTWDGYKLREWAVDASVVLSSPKGDLAIWHSGSKHARVHSYRRNEWTAPLTLKDGGEDFQPVGLLDEPSRVLLVNGNGTKLMSLNAHTGKLTCVLKFPRALTRPMFVAPFGNARALLLAESLFDDAKVVCTVIDFSAGTCTCSRAYVSTPIERLVPLNSTACAVVLPQGTVQLWHLNVALPYACEAFAKADVAPLALRRVMEFMQCVSV